MWYIEECSHLALKTLNQVTNGHTGRNGMGVDNDIRCDAFTREGHILEQGNIQSILARISCLRKVCAKLSLLKNLKGIEICKKQLCPLLKIF